MGELPWGLWVRWWRLEQVEPFQDRRSDLQAFLVCRVLARVIHEGIEPTPEMFQLSAPLEGYGSEPDGSEGLSPADVMRVRANFARVGISSYYETSTP